MTNRALWKGVQVFYRLVFYEAEGTAKVNLQPSVHCLHLLDSQLYGSFLKKGPCLVDLHCQQVNSLHIKNELLNHLGLRDTMKYFNHLSSTNSDSLNNSFQGHTTITTTTRQTIGLLCQQNFLQIHHGKLTEM